MIKIALDVLTALVVANTKAATATRRYTGAMSAARCTRDEIDSKVGQSLAPLN